MAFSPPPPQAYTRDMIAAAFEWLHTQPASVRELAQDSNTLVSLYLQSRRRASATAASRVGESVTPSSAAFKEELKNLAEGFKQFEDPGATVPPLASPPKRPHMTATGTGHIPISAAAPQANTPPQHSTPRPQMPHIYSTPPPPPPIEVIPPMMPMPNPQQTGAHPLPPLATTTPIPPLAPMMSPPPPQSTSQGFVAPQMPSHPTASAGMGSFFPPGSIGAVSVTTQTTSAAIHAPSSYAVSPSLHLDAKSNEILRKTQAHFNLSSEKEALRLLLTLGFERIKELMPKDE